MLDELVDALFNNMKQLLEGSWSIFRNAVVYINKDKIERFKDSQSLYEDTKNVFRLYSSFFQGIRDIMMIWKLSGIEVRHDEIVRFKERFNEKSKSVGIYSRREPKAFADAFIDSSEDKYEKRFLFSIIWFFQYSDASVQSDCLSNEEIDSSIVNRLDKSLERSWETASSHLMDKLLKCDSLEDCVRAVDVASRAMSSRFAMVHRTYMELAKSWKGPLHIAGTTPQA